MEKDSPATPMTPASPCSSEDLDTPLLKRIAKRLFKAQQGSPSESSNQVNASAKKSPLKVKRACPRSPKLSQSPERIHRQNGTLQQTPLKKTVSSPVTPRRPQCPDTTVHKTVEKGQTVTEKKKQTPSLKPSANPKPTTSKSKSKVMQNQSRITDFFST